MRSRPIVLTLVVLFELWLTAGDLYIAARLPLASYAGISGPPPWPMALVGTLVGLAGVGMLVGLWTGRLRDSRVTRLITFGVAAGLVADLWTASSRSPSPVESQALSAMTSVLNLAQEQTDHGLLPSDARPLLEALSGLPPAPFFKGGERLTWTLDVRKGCSGPALDDRGREPGSIIYCLSAQRDRAWLAVVSVDGLFGRPFVLTADEPALAPSVPPEGRPEPEPLPEPDDQQP